MVRRGFAIRGRTLGKLAVLAACGVLGATESGAAVFPELYMVTVRPAPDALDQRAAAIRLGMSQLLTRVTGRVDARSHPDMLPLIESAETHMRSYNPLDRERVRVGFIPSRVDQWLETLGWPVWGSERPMTLLWVAVDGGQGERAILSGNPAGDPLSAEMLDLMQAVEEELRLATDERGLPITLPLMDRQDIEAISFVDIWGGFERRIESASGRYRAEALFVAQVRVSDLGIDVRSTLVQGDSRSIVSSRSLRDGIDWLADGFAAQFSMAGGVRTFPLTVLDIRNLADYGSVMTYLEALSVLDSVEVEALGGSVLDVTLTTRSDEDVLRRVLALDGVLLPVDAAAPPPPSAVPAPGPAAVPAPRPADTPVLQPAGSDTLTFRLAGPGTEP